MNTNQKRYLRWEQAIVVYIGREFDKGRMEREEAMHYLADPFALYDEALARAVGVTYKELRDRYTIKHGRAGIPGTVVKAMSALQVMDRCSEMALDMDLTKAKVKAFARRLQSSGVFNECDVREVERMSKDRDWCAEDVLSEVRAMLMSAL